MYWRIKDIEIQGFKSFKTKQRFDFDNLPLTAFVFVSGVNLAEPELEANGAGKSGFFDAVMYLFFGRTVRVKATDLESWSVDVRCSVRGTLISDMNEEYVITRSREPNELTIEEKGAPAKEADQLQIEALLGYDLKSFEYSVIMTQFSRQFFDLDPSEKMKLFDSVMGKELTLWTQKSERAKSIANELDVEIEEEKRVIAHTEGQLEATKSTDFSIIIAEWEKERQKDIDVLCTQEQTLQQEKESLSGKCSETSERLKETNVSFKEEEQIVIQLREESEVFRNSLAEIDKAISVLERDFSNNEKAIKEMQGIQGICPTCRMKVNAEHLKHELDILIESNKTNRDLIKSKKEMLASGKAEANKINQRMSNVQSKINSITSEKIELEKQLLNYHNADSVISRDLTDCAKRKNELLSKVNPYKEQEDKAKRACVSLKRKIERMTQTLGEKEQRKLLCQYWIKGFKEIRYMVVKKAIWDLEIYINDYLHKLGLSDDWGVKLEMDRETQSKTISKGFSVYIWSPENKDKLVPFECWSGGEGQRLRLAGSLGFMDFVRERKGKDWSFEVWDEPTQWLTEGGVEDLLQVLKDRAYSMQKQVFIVDHRSFKSLGVFDAEVQITKDEEGSKICIC